MAEATKHLPKHRPTKDHELPQGRKNWDTPPQQVDGPEGPEPHPTPEEAGAGVFTGRDRKVPQQVQPPSSKDHVEEPDPTGETYPDDPPRPQQIDGPEGPDATDGTELNDAVASQVPGESGKGGPVSVKGRRKPSPAKAAPAAAESKEAK